MSLPQHQDAAVLLDKARVRQAFDRAAERYQEAAVLQREVAQRLLERLDYIRLQPAAILDVGCGPGILGDELAQRYRKAHLYELDLSLGMCRQLKQNLSWTQRLRGKRHIICGDAEQLPLADETVDMVFSNLTIQWCNRLPDTLAEFRRVLRPGGLLMFTTFGPDTLKELRASWAQVDDGLHVSRFLDMHDIGDALLQGGLAEPVMDVENFTLTYADMALLVRDLRDIGATNALQQRPRGLTGRQTYQALVSAYEDWRRDGVLPATYEVVYGHAWKGSPERGNTSVEVELK